MSPPQDIFTPHGTFSPIQAIPPLILLVVGLGFWGWMFRDMLDNRDLSPAEKQNWMFAFIILNVFAAAIYYANVYRPRNRR